MFNLNYADNILNLTNQFTNDFKNFKNNYDFFEELTIIVPSFTVAEFIKKKLAEKYGAVSGLDFKTVETFIAETARNIPGSDTEIILSEDIFKKLITALHQPGFYENTKTQLLKNYIWKDEPVTSLPSVHTEGKIFRISEIMARLFNEYGLSRYNMLKKWKQNGTVFRKNDPEFITESWQMELWNKLFSEYFDENQIPAGIFTAETDFSKAKLPKDVFIFGNPYMSTGYIGFFRKLANYTNIHFYVLNPSEEYWSDVPATKSEKKKFEEHNEKLQINNTEEPNEILSFFGKAARDYITLLNEAADFNFNFSSSRTTGNKNLLNTLKNDILKNKKAGTFTPVSNKGISFINPAGKRKEIEFVANKIMEIVMSGNNIKFSDISVIIHDNDEKDEYLSLIAEIFKDVHDIPFENTYKTINSDSLYLIQVLEALLNLPTGNFTTHEVVNFLKNPLIGGKYGRETVDRWISIINKLKIFRDVRVTESKYYQKDIFNWQQGMKRLAFGNMMTVPDVYEPAIVSESDQKSDVFDYGFSAYIPHEIKQSDFEHAALLIEYTEILSNFKDVVDTFKFKGRKPEEWYNLLTNILNYFIPEYTLSKLTIYKQFTNNLRNLISINEEPAAAPPVTYEMFRLLAKKALSPLKSGNKIFKGRKVAVSSLYNIRPVPFKFSFICGNNEGLFPGEESSDPLDIRFYKPQTGDLTSKDRDKYMFLENILNTSEHVYISWLYRNSTDGSSLYPSFAIQRFKEIADQAAKTNNTELPEFLQISDEPGNSGNFLPLYSKSFQNEFNALRLSRNINSDIEKLTDEEKRFFKIPVGYLNNEIPGKKQYSVSVSQLAKFFESPVLGSAAFHIGNKFTEPELYETDTEPEKINKLLSSNIKKQIWEEAIISHEKPPHLIEKIFNVNEYKGEIPGGYIREKEKTEFDNLLKKFEKAAENKEFENIDLHKIKTYAFGKTYKNRENVILYDAVRLSDDKTGTEFVFTGTTRYFYTDNQFMLGISIGSQKSRCFVRLYIDYLILNASEQIKLPGKVKLLCINDKTQISRINELPVLTPDEARRLLIHLAKLMINGIDHIINFDMAAAFITRKLINGEFDDQTGVLLTGKTDKKLLSDLISTGNLMFDPEKPYNYQPLPWKSRFKLPEEPLEEIKHIWLFFDDINKDFLFQTVYESMDI